MDDGLAAWSVSPRDDSPRDDAPKPRQGPRWYVVLSQPRKELYAAGHLRNQGYKTFVPLVSRRVRHARRTQTVQRPFFPRYMFVRLDTSVDRWGPVRSTFGVASLIMDGQRPKAAPVGVVEALHEAFEDSGEADYRTRLKVGERVRFLAGPFAEALGTLVELDETGRVGVLMEILGAERVVSATCDKLMAVPS